jgi:hypothetical protein
MTLDEIARTLPNGFHDSEIRGVTVNYERRIAEIEMTLDYTSPDGPVPWPPTRDAKVVLRGLKYLAIEPPAHHYPFDDARALDVSDAYNSIGTDASGRRLVSPELLAAPPHQAFATSFFVNDWNSFIHVAADEAELIWAEEKSDEQ